MPVESGSYTPETISRRRKLAEALMGQSMRPRQIGGHLEGLSHLANAFVAAKAMRDVEGQEEELETRASDHARKIGRALIGGENPANAEAALFNAQNPGDLQMVETTAQRMPDSREALSLAMQPEGGLAMERNPALSQAIAEQFKPKEAEPLERVLDPAGKPILKPRSQAAGMTPFVGNGGAESAMLQEYNIYAQQTKAAGKEPVDILTYVQSRTPVTPSFSSIPLDDRTYGVLDQRTGTISPTGQRAPPKAGEGTATEGERTSANYFGRMEASEQLLGDYVPSMTDYIAAQQLMSGGPVRSGMANQVLSSEGQQYYQAAADWVRAKLRKESGAVISPEEMAQEIKTYFPVPGDSPATIEQKRRAREQAMKGMQQMSGRAVNSVNEITIHPRGSEPGNVVNFEDLP